MQSSIRPILNPFLTNVLIAALPPYPYIFLPHPPLALILIFNAVIPRALTISISFYVAYIAAYALGSS